jgi:hypothetical protein
MPAARAISLIAVTLCGLTSHGPAADLCVAPDGRDTNAGTVAEPFATIPRAMRQAKPGDTVFVRGGIYRHHIGLNARDGCASGEPGRPITIRAFPGEEPIFQLSRAFTDPDDWQPAGAHLWVTARGSVTGYDVGCVWHDDQASEKQWSRSGVRAPWDFWFDPTNLCVTVYLESNPAETAQRIEIPVGKQWQHTFQLRGVAHLILDGLTVKYPNTHGIQMSGTHHITVRNCRISHGGGAWIWEDRTRYGNGIELFGEGHDILVEHNTVSHFFDTAITHQGNMGDQSNIIVRNNHISHTKCGLEHWATGPANVRDILYEGNTITDSGDNWANNLQNVWGAIRLMRSHPNAKGAEVPNTGSIERFVVRHNTILRCGSKTGGQQGSPKPFDEHPGIRIIGGPFLVQNNVIRDGHSMGLFASANFHGSITGNTITGCAGSGLVLRGLSPEATVEGNTVENNGDPEHPNILIEQQ